MTWQWGHFYCKFISGGFIETKCKCNWIPLFAFFFFWNFKRKVQLLLFTLAVQCQYIPFVDLGGCHRFLWDFRFAFFFFVENTFFASILVMFLIWFSIFFFNNFIMVLIFLNLPIFWSWQHITLKKKEILN